MRLLQFCSQLVLLNIMSPALLCLLFVIFQDILTDWLWKLQSRVLEEEDRQRLTRKEEGVGVVLWG